MNRWQKIGVYVNLAGTMACSALDRQYPTRNFHEVVDGKTVDFARETDSRGNLLGVSLTITKEKRIEDFFDVDGDGVLDEFVYPVGQDGVPVAVSRKSPLSADLFVDKQKEFDGWMERINRFPYEAAKAAKERKKEAKNRMRELASPR